MRRDTDNIRNPIAIKIMKLVRDGIVSEVGLCALCDFSWSTLQNMYKRPSISRLSLMVLKQKKIITDEDIAKYHSYLENNGGPRTKLRAKKALSNARVQGGEAKRSQRSG